MSLTKVSYSMITGAPINVMDFGASATATPAVNAAALQDAFDYALSVTPHLEVQFPELIDITGHTITLNKSPDYGDRYCLKITGTGGGIKKTDSGFVFQGATPLVGDIKVSGMSFVSENGADTTLWDCNTIIRIESSHNEYLDWDCIADNTSTVFGELFQSCRFTFENIIGGRGYAFRWLIAADCSFENCVVENRSGFLGNYQDVGADPNLIQNHNIRVVDNVIEGLVYEFGAGIVWGNSWGCTIARNYMEFNEIYIDLDTLVRNAHYGLTVSGNAFYMTPQQKIDHQAAIKVGNLQTMLTTTTSSHANFFSCNVSDGELYYFVGTGTLNSFGDYSVLQYGWDNINIVVNSGSNEVTSVGGHNVKKSGVATTFSFTNTATTVTAHEVRTIAISLSDADVPGIVNESTIYTVYPRDVDKISVLGISPVYATDTSGTLYVTIENRTGSTVASTVLAINVLIIGN